MKKAILFKCCAIFFALFIVLDGVGQTKCGVDSLNYLYYKTSQFRAVALNASTSGSAFAQWYPAPQALTIHGFEFYAWQSDSTNAKVTITCNLYRAGTDSLPTGGPLRSETVTVDSSFGGGQLNVLKKFVKFSTPISLNYPYIISVETASSISVSVICNDYLVSPGNGRKEWLTAVRIGANFLRGYKINVGGRAFDADFILEPHISYTLDADFSFVGCNTTNNIIAFNNTSSKVISSPFYNRYAYFNILQFCHMWDYGDSTGSFYSVDGSHKYNYPVSHDVKLWDTLYGWKNGCGDTEIKTVYANPPAPTAYNSGPVCSGDSIVLWVDTVQGNKYFWDGPKGFTSNLPRIVLQKSDTSQIGKYNVGSVANNCASPKAGTLVDIHQTPATPVTLNVGSKCVGDSVHFKATSTSAALNFQWTGPNGFTSTVDEFWFTNLDTTYRGQYIVFLDDGTCKSANDTAELYIYPPPQPPVVSTFTGSTLCEGDTLYLKGGSVTGAVIDWQGPNGFISTQTHPIIPKITASNAGFYSAYVIIGSCTSTADSVEITVNPKPTVALTATSPTSFCDGDSAAFIATSTGQNYKWFNNGAEINGAQTAVYTTTVGGNYYVQATNTFGCTDTSVTIPITVKPLPVITQQPAMQAIHLDWDAMFHITSPDGGAIYQWQENTGGGFTNLLNNSTYTGVQSNTLTVSNITPVFNNNLYRCMVTLAGCETISDSAALTINIGIQKIINTTQLNAYPNPATTVLNVDVQLDKPLGIGCTVLDATGKEINNTIYSLPAQKHTVTIDISTLARGIYMLKVNAGQETKILRFEVN